MKLRARWAGPAPKVGDYLMSEVRPRHAYRVGEVINVSSKVRWDAEKKTEVRLLQIVVDRVATTAVPRGARIHAWKWDRRAAKGAP